MKLSSLKLSPAVIAGLYSKTLVTTGEAVLTVTPAAGDNLNETASANAPAGKIKFLGENRSRILVAVDNKNIPFLPEEELSFLVNMLTACKLELADVAIINLGQLPDANYKQVLAEFSSSTVLLFGPDPSALQLPVSFPQFQVQTFNNCTFLYTPALQEMQADKILKSKLWVCLRRVFAI